MLRGKLGIGLLAVLALLAIAPASAAAAGTITVNETEDAKLVSGETTCVSEAAGKGCTLRAAVELADNEGGEVTIDLPEGDYKLLPAASLSIKDGVSITIDASAGAGKTIIEGQPNASIFVVEGDGSLTVEGVTVEHGGTEGSGGAFDVGVDGELTIEKSTITENKAEDGGGIFGEAGSSITIKASRIEKNTSEFDGGGISGESDDDSGASIAIEEGSMVVNNTSTDSDGGGVHVESEECDGSLTGGLTVKQSTIADNTAGGDGGGIAAFSEEQCGREEARSADFSAEQASPAVIAELFSEDGLTVEQSTIADNSAGIDADGEGGGIFERAEIDDPIVNSTIAGNIAGESGGGIYSEDRSVAVLISDTVSENTNEEGGAGNNLAGGETGTIGLRNTIVAEEPGGHEQNCEGDVGSLIDGAGYNLDYPSEPGNETPGPDTCGMSKADNDLVGEKPELSSEGLHNNGGPTETIALLSTSPAIGFVPVKEDCEEESANGGPGSVDQRGEPRPGIAGDGCDIGAYEYQQAPQVEPTYDLSLSPLAGEDEAGTTHTHSVTATVTEEGVTAFASHISRAAVGAAVTSVDVTFALTGQNSGVTGTCTTPEGASDPECATNSEGKVVFTYADKNGAGADTIDASTALGGKTEQASASMTWTAPPAKPTTSTTPATTTTTASTPVAKGEVLPFKVVVQCSSKRDITIHIQNVKQFGVVSAVVSIDGKHRRTLTGKQLTTAINLIGLPKGTFTIEIVAHTRRGHTLHGERLYHTCHTKLPGHSYLPL